MMMSPTEVQILGLDWSTALPTTAAYVGGNMEDTLKELSDLDDQEYQVVPG
jgi:hypothetical protein